MNAPDTLIPGPGRSRACRCRAVVGLCYHEPPPPWPSDVAVWRHFLRTVEWRIEEARRER